MTANTLAFLEDVLPRMKSADRDLHNGDCRARTAMWSRNEPVTLFGAAYTVSGWDDVGPVFEKLAAQFSDCSSFEIDVVGADAGADFGYVVAIERTTASIGGATARCVCVTGNHGLPPRGRGVEGRPPSR